jgi:energy-converting hydrogenase Eha subunit A
MSDADDTFTQATDNLIELYRSLERKTLDLPLTTITPFLNCFWAGFRFGFFLFVGIFLIIPTNLIILVRNLFPGHWRYRPFFLTHLYYLGLWVWRGEAPTAPLIFIRPVLGVFLKEHFASRLRRLRQEIVLHDGLSDTTRSALAGRLDSALQLWKPPRFGTLRLTVLWTSIISLPAWSKQLTDLLGWLGIQTDTVAKFFSENISTGGLIYFGLIGLGYLLAVPITAFIAKRGLFIGADRIWFPGWQERPGSYLKESEILGSVEAHVHEVPLDLWALGISISLSTIFGLVSVVQVDAWIKSWVPQLQFSPPINALRIELIFITVLIGTGIIIAALRRGRTGRA